MKPPPASANPVLDSTAHIYSGSSPAGQCRPGSVVRVRGVAGDDLTPSSSSGPNTSHSAAAAKRAGFSNIAVGHGKPVIARPREVKLVVHAPSPTQKFPQSSPRSPWVSIDIGQALLLVLRQRVVPVQMSIADHLAPQCKPS